MKVLNNLKLAHQAPNIYRKGVQTDKIKIRVGHTKYLNQTTGARPRQLSTNTWYDIYQYKNEQHYPYVAQNNYITKMPTRDLHIN